MQFYKDERTGLFIDGSNLYAAARALGFDIDYKKLLEYFQSKTRIVRAFYYTALVDDQEFSPIRPLVDWLDYNGYTMVTKPAKEFTDSQGRRKIKGNMDVDLAVDVMKMSQHLDHIVIFSGDGDFRPLVQAVQERGARVSVVGTIQSQSPMVADELRRQADVFIELGDLRDHIIRTEYRNQSMSDVKFMQKEVVTVPEDEKNERTEPTAPVAELPKVVTTQTPEKKKVVAYTYAGNKKVAPNNEVTIRKFNASTQKATVTYSDGKEKEIHRNRLFAIKGDLKSPMTMEMLTNI